MSAHILAQEKGSDELCVMLTGELDHHASEQLRDKLDDMITVSYTHLDVYKRQAITQTMLLGLKAFDEENKGYLKINEEVR